MLKISGGICVVILFFQLSCLERNQSSLRREATVRSLSIKEVLMRSPIRSYFIKSNYIWAEIPSQCGVAGVDEKRIGDCSACAVLVKFQLSCNYESERIITFNKVRHSISHLNRAGVAVVNEVVR